MFDALGSETRRRILDLIKADPGCTVGEVASQFDTSRIAVMHHLRQLEQRRHPRPLCSSLESLSPHRLWRPKLCLKLRQIPLKIIRWRRLTWAKRAAFQAECRGACLEEC